jgi:hypothetical protein
VEWPLGYGNYQVVVNVVLSNESVRHALGAHKLGAAAQHLTFKICLRHIFVVYIRMISGPNPGTVFGYYIPGTNFMI